MFLISDVGCSYTRTKHSTCWLTNTAWPASPWPWLSSTGMRKMQMDSSISSTHHKISSGIVRTTRFLLPCQKHPPPYDLFIISHFLTKANSFFLYLRLLLSFVSVAVIHFLSIFLKFITYVGSFNISSFQLVFHSPSQDMMLALLAYLFFLS